MTASEVILTYCSWPLFLKVLGTSRAHSHIISKSKSTKLQSSCLIKTKLRKISQDILLVDDRHPPSDIIKRTWGGVELITTLVMNRIILSSQAMGNVINASYICKLGIPYILLRCLFRNNRISPPTTSCEEAIV